MICLKLTVFFTCKVICNKRFFGFFLVILGADQKDRSVWELDCPRSTYEFLRTCWNVYVRSRSNRNWKCWFFKREENWSTWRKTSRSKGENQQKQIIPTYGADAGVRTRATLVEGECSHHWATLAPLKAVIIQNEGQTPIAKVAWLLQRTMTQTSKISLFFGRTRVGHVM